MDLLSIEFVQDSDNGGKHKEETLVAYSEHVAFLTKNYESSKLKNQYTYVSPLVSPFDEAEYTRD